MLKNILILDLDTNYVENVAAWAGLHVRNKVCLHILTNPLAIDAIVNGSVSFDCVLVTPSMLLAFENVPKFSFQWDVFLLDDGKIVPESHMPTNRYKTISKYQSVRTIFEYILESTLPQKTERAISTCSKKTETFFCLSAGFSSDEMPLAAGMAMLLSSWRRKVFYLDFEFGLSQNPFLTACEGIGMCDLLLHAKRVGQKETRCISDCTVCDPVSGVYTFRDGAGALDHEELDRNTIEWVLSELKQQTYYDDVVIHAGTRFGSAVSNLFWHSDISFLVYDGLYESKTMRCHKMLDTLLAKKHSESVTKPNLLPVVHNAGEIGIASHLSEMNRLLANTSSSQSPNTYAAITPTFHTAILSPNRGLNWMQDTVFLEGIASILLPLMQGRG